MAHSLSAKKRVRQNEKRRARNRHRKDLIKGDVKGYLSALASGDVAKATEALNQVASRLDRVATKNTIHRNAAARKRSRLTKKLNALKAGAKGTTLAASATGKGS